MDQSQDQLYLSLIQIKNTFQKKLLSINTLEAINNLEIEYLGKNGLMNKFFHKLKNVPISEKKKLGFQINSIKSNIINALVFKKTQFKEKNFLENQQKENIDVTLPSLNLPCGSIHPLNQVIKQIENIFLSLGYTIHEGLEIEQELYNFDFMNMSKNHPSREMQDSFYIDKHKLLRTHTSAVQVKVMLANKSKPLRIISSGKVFRRDKDDMKHSHQFMQLEGFLIDKKVSMIDLKKHISFFLRAFFSAQQQIRFRPSYFPFTEPSIEVDLLVDSHASKKIYLEILGAGLIHPEVMKKGGYDPLKYQGFAFGLGIERLAMLKYQIKDIRHFYQNDTRFLKQFI